MLNRIITAYNLQIIKYIKNYKDNIKYIKNKENYF
jgi:hypothetical protein